MTSDKNDHEAPVLSEQGAAILADAVANRSKSTVRAHKHKQKGKRKRLPPRPVDISAPETNQPTAAPRAPKTPGVLVGLAAIMFVGFVVVGVAVATALVQGSEEPDVTTEVAGAVEENDVQTGGATDDAEPDTEQAPADDAGDAESVAEPTDDSSSPAESDPEPDEEQPAQDADGELSFVLGDGIALSVYDIDPANSGTRSFAIRISNAGSELVPSTEPFGIEIEVEGERLPALVRFTHEEIPGGSSAIASVRAENIPDGPASAVLVFDGADVDVQELP